ncbi:hypothetical protein JKP88DRAFT_236201 [Tribonema minus]|uniref:Uncharacterized protein n=1 Tax=Tribonema minus TaxID=303371 RepID=A0A835ZBR5_9STRA|nr:hypothetical protein JKP88DRAFT_236201 [Tribonema minus]
MQPIGIQPAAQQQQEQQAAMQQQQAQRAQRQRAAMQQQQQTQQQEQAAMQAATQQHQQQMQRQRAAMQQQAAVAATVLQAGILDVHVVDGWRSNADIPLRRTIMVKIADLFLQHQRNATSKWLNHVLHVVKKMEHSLYRSAESRTAYADISTLWERVRAKALRVTRQVQ